MDLGARRDTIVALGLAAAGVASLWTSSPAVGALVAGWVGGLWVSLFAGRALDGAGAAHEFPPGPTAWPGWLGRAGLAVGVALAFAVPVLMLWPAITGDMMVSGQHPFELYATQYTEESLLPFGHLSGWSHSYMAGYPAGELEPVGGRLLVHLLGIATLGRVPTANLYGIAVALSMGLAVAGLLVLAFRWFGPWGAAVAGVLLSLDPGSAGLGGWEGAVVHGDWGGVLASGLLLWVWWLLEGPWRWWRLGLASLLLAWAAVSHPWAALVGALGLIAAMPWRWARRGPSDALGLGLVVAAGLGLAGPWLMPAAAWGWQVGSHGEAWLSLAELSGSLLGGGIFEGSPAALTVLGGLGLLGLAAGAGQVRGLARGVALVGLAAPLLAAGGMDHLPVLRGLAPLQAARPVGLVMMAKPAWYLGLAYATSAIVARARGLRSPWAAALLALVAYLPARSTVSELRTAMVSRAPRTLLGEPSARSMVRAAGWLREHAPEGPWRLGLAARDHTLVTIATLLRQPFVELGPPSESGYGFSLPMDLPCDTLSRLGVRFLVDRGAKACPTGSLVAKFGGLRIFDLGDAAWRPFTSEHVQGVSLLTFEPGRIVMELSGVEPPATLDLLVGYHPRWVARLNDTPLTVTPARISSRAHGLRVRPDRGGILTFEYESTTVERLSGLLGLAWALLLLAAVAVVAVPAWRDRISGMASWSGWVAGLVWLAATAPWGWLVVVTPRSPGLSGPLVEHMDDLRVKIRASATGLSRPCTRAPDRGWLCPGGEASLAPGVIQARGRRLACLEVDLARGRSLELTLDPRWFPGGEVTGRWGASDRDILRITRWQARRRRLIRLGERLGSLQALGFPATSPAKAIQAIQTAGNVTLELLTPGEPEALASATWTPGGADRTYSLAARGERVVLRISPGPRAPRPFCLELEEPVAGTWGAWR